MALAAQNNILNLTELVRADPKSYKDDFLMQLKHVENMLEIFKMRPADENKTFCSLLNFIAVSSKHYAKEVKHLPEKLITLLEQQQDHLQQNVRRAIVNALIQLRNLELIEAKILLPVMFKLFGVRDKFLRKIVFGHIIGDICRINQKKKNDHVNRSLQNFMYTMLKDTNRLAAKKSLEVLITLYKRRVWNDDRTVNVIASACFVGGGGGAAGGKSSAANTVTDNKMLVVALKFFLGTNADGTGEDEEDEETKRAEEESQRLSAVKELQYQLSLKGKTKLTKKKKRAVEKATKRVQKKKKDRNRAMYVDSLSHIHRIHDPQSFAEKLFSKLKQASSDLKFEIRIMMLDVISRCIAAHSLILLNFYPFVQRYLEPHQLYVTRILAIAAQAVHDLVPDDALHSMVMTIANNFINDRSKAEAVVVGLNTIREIARRQPHVMTKSLLRDLSAYQKHKSRAVQQAAKGLVKLFRALDAKMLARKDRGRLTELDGEPSHLMKEYGALDAVEDVEGIELLEEEDGEVMVQDSEEGDEDDEVQADGEEGDDDDESGWVDIDAEEGEGSDDDEDQMVDEDEEAGALNTEELDYADVEVDSDEEGEGEDEDDSEDDGEEGSEDDDDEEDGEEVEGEIEVGSDDDDEDDEDSGDEEAEEEEPLPEPPKKKSRAADGSATVSSSSSSIAALAAKILSKKQSKTAAPAHAPVEETAAAEPAPKRKPLAAMRVLSQEDFERMDRLKMQKMAEKASQTKKSLKKRKREEEQQKARDENSTLVRAKDLGSQQLAQLSDDLDDDERVDTRAGKEKWQRRDKRVGGSKTNKEKRKNKNFMMLKYSQRVQHKNVQGDQDRRKKKEAREKREIKHKIKFG